MLIKTCLRLANHCSPQVISSRYVIKCLLHEEHRCLGCVKLQHDLMKFTKLLNRREPKLKDKAVGVCLLHVEKPTLRRCYEVFTTTAHCVRMCCWRWEREWFQSERKLLVKRNRLCETVVIWQEKTRMNKLNETSLNSYTRRARLACWSGKWCRSWQVANYCSLPSSSKYVCLWLIDFVLKEFHECCTYIMLRYAKSWFPLGTLYSVQYWTQAIEKFMIGQVQSRVKVVAILCFWVHTIGRSSL